MHPLVRELGARLRSFVRSPHTWGVLATLVVVGVLFLLPHRVLATEWESYLAGAIAWVLGLIVNFLGKIIGVLIYILMGFLQYNDFANAPPVMMGWVIIRDLMNMVFIVVLIISAVATILNYETSDLHVKNVLPKLIAAAVLINFSKMIVGILIDVSQVVMLTFVNAFQASGVGNFSQLLGLPSFTQLSGGNGTTATASATPTGDGAAGGQIILDVLLAYMLAMAMLVISIGVILIMILFTIARIVGIWVLLIISPAAFLATSLPKKLQKIFGSLAHDFWEKLTAFLVGGPTMAFFLWLAFATVHSTQQMTAEGGVATRLHLFNRDASHVSQNGVANIVVAAGEQGTNAFLSRVGNADGIASFIVGIALMLIGLEQATRAAGAASATLGKYAGSIASGAKGAASWIANRPVRMGGALAKGGWNAFDSRVKLTDKVANMAVAIPGMKTFMESVTGVNAGKYVDYRKVKNKNAGIEDAALHGRMSGVFQRAKGRSINFYAKTAPILGTDADRHAAMGIGKHESSDAGYNEARLAASAKHEAALRKNRPVDQFSLDPVTGQPMPIDDDELKNQARAHAAGEADHERSHGFKTALQNAKDLEDWKAVAELEEAADKSPSMWKDTDRARYGRAIKKMEDADFEKNDGLTSDGDAMLTRAQQAGAISVDASGAITGINAANFDQMVANMPKAAKRIRAVQAAVEGNASPAGTVTAAAVSGIRNSAFMQDAAKMTSRVYNGSTGARVYSPLEKTNREGLQSTFAGGTHGRTGAGVLDGAATGAVDTALDKTNIGIKELMDIDTANSGPVVAADGAIPQYIGKRMKAELGATPVTGTAWVGATNVQAAMQTVAKAGEQMKDLDDASQSTILKAVTTSGKIQKMSENLADMSEYQQEQLLNMARQAKELARSADTGIKSEAVKFLDEMKKHMPENKVTVTVAGVTTSTQATPAFKAVLYKK